MVYWLAENIGLAWGALRRIGLETEPRQFVRLCIRHVYISVNTNSSSKEVTRQCGWQNGEQLIGVASCQWGNSFMQVSLCLPQCVHQQSTAQTVCFLPDRVENVGGWQADRLSFCSESQILSPFPVFLSALVSGCVLL